MAINHSLEGLLRSGSKPAEVGRQRLLISGSQVRALVRPPNSLNRNKLLMRALSSSPERTENILQVILQVSFAFPSVQGAGSHSPQASRGHRDSADRGSTPRR